MNDVNIIKNAAFSDGKSAPRGWQWAGDAGASWSRDPSKSTEEPVMTLRYDRAGGTAMWTRRVPVKSGEYYRVEWRVSGDWQASHERAGCVLRIQPMDGKNLTGEPLDLPALDADDPRPIMGIYKVPKGIRAVSISVGLCEVAGEVTIHGLTMMHILEPDTKSHMHACPPPPSAYPPAKRVRSALVCADDDRPIVDLLRSRLGAKRVTQTLPSKLSPKAVQEDAVLIPGDRPAGSVRSIGSLLRLAHDKLVVISLQAFATMAGGADWVRTVRQPDDPIHAAVRFANFITQGLAIADVFPFAWRDADAAFVQRQFRRNADFKALCKQHDFEVILLSECEKDATTDRPVCLYRPTEHGGVVVMDIEPAECSGSALNETELAGYLLCNVLGLPQNASGQFVVPADTEKAFRDDVIEMGKRLPAVVVHGDTHPDRPRRDQHVVVGGGGQSFGLPVPPRREIVLRTGLVGGHAACTYGVLYWLKHLARPMPYACPYTRELIAGHKLVWIPQCSPWPPGDGWRRHPDEPYDLPISSSPHTRAVIDITSTRSTDVCLSFDSASFESTSSGDAKWGDRIGVSVADALARQFDGRFYRFGPEGWQPRTVTCTVRDSIHRDDTDSTYIQEARAFGASYIRLAMPFTGLATVPNSIWMTDLVVTCVEAIVGAMTGLVLMNRGESAISLDVPVSKAERMRLLHAPGANGDEGSTQQRASMSHRGAHRDNGRILVPAGAALWSDQS